MLDNKMTVLAVDTTAGAASASIVSDGKTLGLYTVDAGNTHSVTILPMIENLLKICNATLDSIDAFAVSVGPGSFTGVRIGTATIKGLAFKSKKPCIGVSTLEALARNLKGFEGIICPCMNARRNQVYTAIFKGDGKTVKRLTDDMAVSVDELSEMLSKYSEKIYFCGDGYFLVSHLCDTYTPDELRLQNAASVAKCAIDIYSNSCGDSFLPENLTPTYLRKPQAEREREERLKTENDK